MKREAAPGRTAAIPLLPACLAIQALLYFWNLRLLSPWFDEADMLLVMHSSLRQAVLHGMERLHPPLFLAAL